MGRIYGVEIGVPVPSLQLNSLQLAFLTYLLSLAHVKLKGPNTGKQLHWKFSYEVS